MLKMQSNSKKELKKRIFELERERNRAVSDAEAWKDMLDRFLKKLEKEHDIKSKIIFPEPPMIECTIGEDGERRFIKGITTEPPTISFDFTVHDNKIKVECVGSILEGKLKGEKRYE